jgi:hypothetical protein
MQDHGCFTTSGLKRKWFNILKPVVRHFSCDLPVVSLQILIISLSFKSERPPDLEYLVSAAGDCSRYTAHA